MMMHLRPGYFLLLAASLLAPASLRAQQQTLSTPDQETDVAVTYTEQHSNLVSTPAFWLPGGSVELSAQVYHGLGFAANVTGNTVTNAANSGVGLSMVTANFGPRFTFYRPAGAGRKHGLAIFGQGLVGQAWGFNSYFPSTSGVHTNYDSFALQVGGGVDIGLSRHFAVRVFQGDWLRTEFPNASTNVQNNFRLAAGIVLRIPQRQQ
jgi:hypothetical protein